MAECITGNMNYKVQYDYHTHTVYSHGKGTIEENVRKASEKGLSGIAISDHGPGHVFYGVNQGKIQNMRKEIKQLRNVYKDMDIFLSVEANILNIGNCLDVAEQEIREYDFIIAGYHFGVKNGYCVRNFLYNLSKISFSGRKNLMRKNTDMVIKAIYENPIKILTHPGDKAPFDIIEIAKACADRGTLLEISAHHKNLTVEEIKQVSKIDVKFIVSSDAHIPDKVGECASAIQRAALAGLDMSRIVNIVKC
jgi:putative hydrolase